MKTTALLPTLTNKRLAMIFTLTILLVSSMILQNSSNFSLGDKTKIAQNTSSMYNDLIISQLDQTPITPGFTGFIQNMGQNVNSEINYYFEGSSSYIGFDTSQIHIWQNFIGDGENLEQMQLGINFDGANLVKPIGIGKMPHSTNYLKGDLKLINIPSFREVWYYDIYSNIDLRYYVGDEGLKYEFIVNPEGNPNEIFVHLSDNMNLIIQPLEVEIRNYDGLINNRIIDTNLKVFQSNGEVVKSTFTPSIIPNSYGFSVGSYDASQILVIDPLLMGFSTYLGGSDDEQEQSVAIDSSGNVYVTGKTLSTDFPYSAGSLQSNQTPVDGFVTKFNANGVMQFTTYIGGNGIDRAFGIAVDSSMDVYIVGQTTSTNFPVTTGAYQLSLSSNFDLFLTKLDSTGTSLVFSTYFGGDFIDSGTAITLDAIGNIYITGTTLSSDFPTTLGAYSRTFNGLSDDSFISKFSSTGSLISSTYIGGGGRDEANGIAVDASQNVYIIGDTNSNDYPTVNAYQSTYGGGSEDAFVTKISSTFSTLILSTYLGSTSYDYGHAISVDSSNNMYITGYTESTGFPLVGAIDNSFAGFSEAYVAKLSSDGLSLIFSTFIGGDGTDRGWDLALDSNDDILIAGYTTSTDLPVVNAFQTTFGGLTDAFITKIYNNGSGFVYNSYLGGAGIEVGWGIAVGPSDNAVIVGQTASTNYPTVNPYQSAVSGGYDTFVTEIHEEVVDTTNPTIDSPADITVEEGATGNSIIWTPFDDNPSSYSVTLDGNINVNNAPWSGGQIVRGIVSTLTVGTHTYIITVSDVAGNTASDTVVVTVTSTGDTTSPIIDSPSDLTVVEGETGNSITWTPSDANPSSYSVTLDGNINVNNAPWSGGQIVRGIVSTLTVGTHTYIITVSDVAGNTASDTVVVTVTSSGDTTPPTIDSPPDKTVEEGATGNSITWTPSDANPSSYSVTLDGNIDVNNAPWGGEQIVRGIVNTLTVGAHSYMITVSDVAGNSVSDEVIVNVIPAGTEDTLPPTIDSPDDITYLEGTTGQTVTWNPMDANPDTYDLALNDNLIIIDDIWTGGPITIDVSGLPVGIHIYDITVFDVGRLTASDSVEVVVTTVFENQPIMIQSSVDFVIFGIPGSGTEIDPYVISNLDLIVYSGTGIVISDVTDYFVIENNVLDGSNGADTGIELRNVIHATIIGNEIFGFLGDAIYMSDSDAPIIIDNFLHDIGDVGIQIENTHGGLIDGNTIERNTYGINMLVANSWEVTNNVITTSEFEGIALDRGDFILIGYNLVSDTGGWSGINIGGSNSVTVEFNRVWNSMNGIALSSTNNSQILTNELFDNMYSGLRVTDESYSNTLSWNVVYNLGENGLWIDSTSADIVVEFNDFSGPSNWGSLVIDDGVGDTFMNNYYSDWSGVGSYNIDFIDRFSDNEDTTPADKPYHMSDLGTLQLQSGGTTLTGIVILDWLSVTDDWFHPVTYTFWYQDPSLGIFNLLSGYLTDSSFEFDSTNLPDGEYLFRVDAQDDNFDGFIFSTFQIFIIKNVPDSTSTVTSTVVGSNTTSIVTTSQTSTTETENTSGAGPLSFSLIIVIMTLTLLPIIRSVRNKKNR